MTIKSSWPSSQNDYLRKINQINILLVRVVYNPINASNKYN